MNRFIMFGVCCRRCFDDTSVKSSSAQNVARINLHGPTYLPYNLSSRANAEAISAEALVPLFLLVVDTHSQRWSLPAAAGGESARMAERMSSRTAVRMAIGFMTANSTSMEATPSREGVDDPTVVKEESAAGRERPPRRRSARVNEVYSPGAHHRRASAAASPATAGRSGTAVASELAPPRQLSTSPAEGARRTSLSNETALRHYSRVPIATPAATPAAGSRDAWQAAQEEDLRTSHGEPAQASRWVRFAWEPLVVGETEHGGRHHLSVPSTRGGGSGGGSGGRVGSVAGISNGATPPRAQELAGGSAHRQGDEMLGVKRYRASAVGYYREETERADSTSYNNRRLTRRVPIDRRDWPQPSLGDGWPRRQQSLRQQPRRVDFEMVDGSASREEMVSATRNKEAVVGRSDAARVSRDYALPQRAAKKRGGGRGGLTAGGGINTRSSGWGRDVTMHNEMTAGLVLQRRVDGGSTAAATMDRQYLQEKESGSREERGNNAKKPRYHYDLEAQGALSVSHHVDSLTDGVSSLGVASPGGAAASNGGGGKWKPIDAARRRTCVWRREAALTGSTRYVLPQEPVCPVLALGGVGWNSDIRGAATTSTGAGAAKGSTAARYQKERRIMNSGAGIGGGRPGYHLSKKRRNCSLSAGGGASSPFR